jgi:hypothetical protein
VPSFVVLPLTLLAAVLSLPLFGPAALSPAVLACGGSRVPIAVPPDNGPCPRRDDGFGPVPDFTRGRNEDRCSRRVSVREDSAVCGSGHRLAASVGAPREAWCETTDALFDGPYERWYLHGVRSAAGQYVGGWPEGEWTWWAADGSVLSQGTYAHGRKTGTWTQWWPNGRVAETLEYRGGKPDGVLRRYYAQGEAAAQGGFRAGQRDGVWQDYFHSGALLARLMYEGGSLASAQYWEADGKPRDGCPTGLTATVAPSAAEPHTGPRPAWAAIPLQHVDATSLCWYGVGSAQGIKNKALLRMTADNRARFDVQQSFIDTPPHDLRAWMQENELLGADLTYDEAEHLEQSVCAIINDFVSVCMYNVMIIERWKDADAQIALSRTSAALDDCLWAMEDAGGLDPIIRRHAWKFAGWSMRRASGR